MSEPSKFLLTDSQIPSVWVNVLPSLPQPLEPPLNPQTRAPLTPQDLLPLFPMELIQQEFSPQPLIDIPGEVMDVYRLWRATPLYRARRLEKALDAVLGEAGIAGISANFLKVLTANRRLFAVTDVIRAFNALVAKFKGEAVADVTVAEALSDKNLDALKAALKTVTGKDVALNVKVDSSIIGGLVVKLGSRMVDSSLRTKLNSIKHAMKEAG